MGLLRKLKIALKNSLPSKENVKYSLGTNTLINNVTVEMRNGPAQPARCVFGRESVISGTFVLETAEASIEVGERTFIGGGHFICTKKITIGSDVLISWGCTFIDTNAHSLDWRERRADVDDWRRGLVAGHIGKFKDWTKVASNEIKIGDKCWIGFNTIILKGVEIGEGSIIGAGSVVTSNVPPYTVYAGNPAAFVKNVEN